MSSIFGGGGTVTNSAIVAAFGVVTNPSTDQLIQPTVDKTFQIKQFNGTNAVDIFQVLSKGGVKYFTIDKDGNALFGGSGAGTTEFSTGAMAVSTGAGFVRIGANTGNVFSASENGGAVQAVLLAGKANTLAAGGTLDMSAATNGATGFKVPVVAGAAPTANGALGFDSTQIALMAGGNGAVTGRVPRLLATLVCNSTSCVGTGTGLTVGTFTNNCISGGADANCTNAGTTETAFGFSYTIPANFLGPNNSIKANVYVERTGTATVPTFLMKMKVGGIIVYQSQTSTPGTLLNGVGASLKIQGVSALGASVVLETGINGAISGSGGVPFTANQTAQPVAGFDTTAANALTFTLQLGAATIGNFVRVRQVDIWGY